MAEESACPRSHKSGGTTFQIGRFMIPSEAAPVLDRCGEPEVRADGESSLQPSDEDGGKPRVALEHNELAEIGCRHHDEVIYRLDRGELGRELDAPIRSELAQPGRQPA
jgi:hypothetical protein